MLSKRSSRLLWIATWACVCAASDSKLTVPPNYRSWTHVKSVVVGPQSQFFEGSGGIHHIYANEPAMDGLRTGKFPDGSAFVFDLLEGKENAGVTSEGARTRIDMMLKDNSAYAGTGGWGFERFPGETPSRGSLDRAGRQRCFDCHKSQSDRDFVFSVFGSKTRGHGESNFEARAIGSGAHPIERDRGRLEP